MLITTIEMNETLTTDKHNIFFLLHWGGGGGSFTPKSFTEKKNLQLFQIKIFLTTILRNQ